MARLRLILMFVAAVLIASCETTDDPTPDTRPSRTVLVYMVADNSLNSRTSEDISEMMEGILGVDDSSMKCNLLVYVDDASKPVLYKIHNGNGVAQKTVIKAFDQEMISTDAEVLRHILSIVSSDYAADSYGFVYWSHGDGWLPSSAMKLRSTDVRWIGQDNGSGQSQYGDITATADELQAFSSDIDFVLFDACYMLTAEVAYEFKDCTKYIIGSPTEIPGPGAPYDKIVPQMFSTQTSYVSGIAQAYYDYYNAKYNGGTGISDSNWTGGVAIGMVDESHMAALASATANALASANDSDPATLRDAAIDYDQRSTSRGHIGYYDLVQMMSKLLPQDTYTSWHTAYSQALPYWQTTDKNYSAYTGMFSMEGANGMSQYIPAAANTSILSAKGYVYTGWFLASGLDKLGWFKTTVDGN